jgi:AcrR family transcriptional regulator
MALAPRAEKRRQQHRDEARKMILEAAAELTAESSFSGFSVRALVERCGYSAPTIYHYFGDKHGLLDALVEDSLQDLVRDMREVPILPDPLETVRALTLCFGNWGLKNPTYYHLLTQPRAEDAKPLAAGETSAGMLTDPLAQLVDEERIEESELDLLRQSLWACLHGLISLPAIRPDLVWQKDLLEASVDRILKGWLSTSDAGGMEKKKSGRIDRST